MSNSTTSSTITANPSKTSGAQAHDYSPRHLGAMLLLALIWGLSIPITKLGLQDLPPLTLTALRFAFAVPLMLLFTLGRQTLPWRALPKVAALGLLGIGIGQVAQTFGVAGTSASVGTIVSATIPLFIVVFAAIRLGQHVSRIQTLGLLTAFAGIALVALGDMDAAATSVTTVWGVGWMLLSSVAIAFYYVWSVELTNEHGTATVAAWSTTFGFLALLPWAGWEWTQAPAQFTAMGIGAAAYLGVFVTVAGLYMWLGLLRVVPARVAAAVQYLQPIFGIAAAAALLGDRLGPAFVVGSVLVLAGLGITLSRR
ncbi:DMT family transporter [Acidovorax sp. Root70]|uniref:DMT family transporter n=1 Tax=Acidovorax sp. Root70 TaxID=1736590 RepID=UPI000AB4EE1E|nr:EamA family transporter [Acidovorax sp. Root70]